MARKRRFEPRDFYSFIVAFMIGCNLPPSVFLFLYVFYPDAPSVQTKLKGHERYISLAGVVLFIASLMALWKLLKDAKNGKTSPPNQ